MSKSKVLVRVPDKHRLSPPRGQGRPAKVLRGGHYYLRGPKQLPTSDLPGCQVLLHVEAGNGRWDGRLHVLPRAGNEGRGTRPDSRPTAPDCDGVCPLERRCGSGSSWNQTHHKTLNPKPYTLNPKPYFLNIKTYTLNPKP